MSDPGVRSGGLVRVEFPMLGEEEEFPNGSEMYWCEPLDGGLFRVDGIPFNVAGVSRNDIVEAGGDENGIPQFHRVAERGGHATIRLIASRDRDVAPLRRRLEALGCSTVVMLTRIVSIDIPPTVVLDRVLTLLRVGHDKGRWVCDVGSIHRARRTRSSREFTIDHPPSKDPPETIGARLDTLEGLEVYRVDMLQDDCDPYGPIYHVELIENEFGRYGFTLDRVADEMMYRGRHERVWMVFPDDVAEGVHAEPGDVTWTHPVRPNDLLVQPFQLSAVVFKLLFPDRDHPGAQFDQMTPAFRADVDAIRALEVAGIAGEPMANDPVSDSPASLGDASSRQDLARLKRRLLELGGRRFQRDSFLESELSPALVTAILREGRATVVADPEFIPGAVNACHDNVRNLVETVPGCEPWTGIGLSEDGCWHVHSWAEGPNGIIETTAPFALYFGVHASLDPDF